MPAEGKSAASLHFNLGLDAGSVSVLSCYPQANQSIATASQNTVLRGLDQAASHWRGRQDAATMRTPTVEDGRLLAQ
jgi:hypothetical protein